MSTFSENLTVSIGDGVTPTEGFNAMELIEVPEFFTGSKATYPNRTTGSTGKTKSYGIGLEEGDELDLIVEHDFEDAAQDRLRAVYDADGQVNIQFEFTDGTITQTSTAAFLVTSYPITPTGPNSDGETVRQTFNVKRITDWTHVEA